MRPTAPGDRLSLALIGLLTVLTIAVGVQAGYRELDVDELVFRRTLVSMQHGEGYYVAMRHALVRKEGAPPTQVRSVRPPTLFLVLSRLPAASWRWVAGLVYLATLLLAWRLARLHAAWAGPAAVTGAGVWLLAASPLLFLHPELWGVPLMLGGALALRDERWAMAAMLLAIAVALRETYAIPFLVGLVIAGRRRPFWIAFAVLLALYGVHVWQAQAILVSHGREAPFGASGLSPSYVLSAVSPSDRPLAWVVGLAGGFLGAVGLLALRREDAAARLILYSSAVLVPATVFIGREYWGLTFGIALASYAPAGIEALLNRFGDRASSPRPSRSQQ